MFVNLYIFIVTRMRFTENFGNSWQLNRTIILWPFYVLFLQNIIIGMDIGGGGEIVRIYKE